MINRLIIKNFRSIKELDIELTNLNAFIGPNSAGKSNILKALNLIAGNTWPTSRSFDQTDFYCHDTAKIITIEIRFFAPIRFNGSSLFRVGVIETKILPEAIKSSGPNRIAVPLADFLIHSSDPVSR